MASSNEARAASQARLAGFGFTLPAVAWILLFFGAPLVIMAAYSLLPLTSDGSPPQFSLKAYGDFFGQPAYVQAIWNSVVTTAIVGLPMIGAAADPRMREFMVRSGQEALDATVGLGNPVLPIFGLTEDALSRPEKRVEVLLDTLLGGFVMPDSKTTILQDWMKGRRSEVDDINGLVAETHRRLGSRAPANEAVVEVAHRIENDELKPGVENLDLLIELERH